MDLAHYSALLVGYGAAVAGWWALARLIPSLWPRREPDRFASPWREVGWAVLGGLGVVAVGQLYVHGWLLPKREPVAPLIEALNQVLIFAPILAVPLLRRHSLRTAWLPLDRLVARLFVGLGLAALAILAFTLVREGSDPWPRVVPRVYQPGNFGLAVQVLCEDVAIAILFVRIAAAIGLRGAIVLVACLFAAAHIPSMLATGASAAEVAGLALDAGLGLVVIGTAQRSADVWWLWCVHYAMDMLQYHALPA